MAEVPALASCAQGWLRKRDAEVEAQWSPNRCSNRAPSCFRDMHACRPLLLLGAFSRRAGSEQITTRGVHKQFARLQPVTFVPGLEIYRRLLESPRASTPFAVLLRHRAKSWR